MKENFIPKQQSSHEPPAESKPFDIGELWSRVTFSKFALGVLALLTLLDSFFVSANHGLFAGVEILHSFYLYIFTIVLIVFWERLKGIFGLAG